MSDCFFGIKENNVSLNKRKTVSEINPGPIFVSQFDREGKLVQVRYNDPSTGIVTKNIVGKNLTHFRLEFQNYKKCEYHLKRAFATAKKEVFQLNVGIRRYHISLLPEKSSNKEIEFVLGIVCDVTKEQKVLDQLVFHKNKLSANQHHLEMAQKIAKLGYFELDISNGTMYCSDQQYANFGYTPQKTTPTVDLFAKRIHPDDSATVKSAVAEMKNAKYSELEFRILKSDHSVGWVYARINAITNQQGHITKLLGVTQDITEKKQTENRIHKAEKDLIFINQVNTRSNYLNRLLLNDYPLEYTSKALSEFGLESHVVYCCFVIQVTDSTGNTVETANGEDDTAGIKQQVLIWLADKGHDKIWNLNNTIILLVALTDEDISTKQYQLDFSHQLGHEIKKHFPTIYTIIGISGSSSIPLNIKDIYEKANRAAIVASADSHPQIVHFDDIGLYEIAFQLIKDKNIVTLAASTIGRLVEYDQTRGGNLLLTLKYILEGDSLKVVAKKLYIHPNTAIWRKHRIEELLSMSLDKMETKVTLMLHLKIWELQNKTDLEKKQ
jgi:PAS domain S-box-containing protein